MSEFPWLTDSYDVQLARHDEDGLVTFLAIARAPSQRIWDFFAKIIVLDRPAVGNCSVVFLHAEDTIEVYGACVCDGVSSEGEGLSQWSSGAKIVRKATSSRQGENVREHDAKFMSLMYVGAE